MNTDDPGKMFGSYKRRNITKAIVIVISIAVFMYSLYLFIDFKGYFNTARYNRDLISFNENFDFQDGDIIFRRGKSFESFMVLLADKGSQYSHVGVIVIENGEAFVIHAEPPTRFNNYDRVRRERVKDFLEHRKSGQYAVFRISDSSLVNQDSVISFVYDCYYRQLQFDDEYDINDSNKLYCSELVWKAYNYGGLDLLVNGMDKIKIFNMDVSIILPSSLKRNRYMKLVHNYK